MNIYNIKLYNYLRNVKYFKRNRNYHNFLKLIADIDSIRNYDIFKENIKCALNCDNLLMDCRYSASSSFYGYYSSFLNYAGVCKELYRLPVFGNMEHGVSFSSRMDRISPFVMTYCSQSDHRKKELRKLSSELMYFSTGPYIHYATEYYDEITKKKLKADMGKTLLVFPFHTCENEAFGKGQEHRLYDIVFQKYGDLFDTIMVCAYWHDVENKIFNYYKDNGAWIVSAGFRGDPQFIRRLKSIISLSDAVVMDEVGTQLGFCYYMGKTVFLEKGNTTHDDMVYQMNSKRFTESFYTDSLVFSEEQKKRQRELYNEFWGGNKIRSSTEARVIVKCLTEILRRSDYNMRKLKERKIPTGFLLELESRSDDESQLMRKLLKESLI